MLGIELPNGAGAGTRCSRCSVGMSTNCGRSSRHCETYSRKLSSSTAEPGRAAAAADRDRGAQGTGLGRAHVEVLGHGGDLLRPNSASSSCTSRRPTVFGAVVSVSALAP